MYKLLKYLKYLLFFIIFFFIISLILAFFATFGVSNLFINKLSVILMAIAAFITSMKAIKEIAGKSYLLVLRLGLLNIISLILINLMFFRSSFDITRFIYYFILLISSILGSSFGKNFHKKN